MSDSPPWGDTPFADFNFAEDCAISARYLAAYVTNPDDVPASAVTDFFRAVVPDRSDLNESTALEWHQFLLEEDYWQSSLRHDLGQSEQVKECLPDMCTSITRSLPNDVIGIGLLVALAIQLLLVIGYCAAALAPYVRKTPSTSGSGPLDRVLHAFYSTTNHFFHLATLLTLGVSIAIIYDGATEISSDDSSANTYYNMGHLLMGATYFPLAATIPSWLWSSRRQWLDGALAVTVWAIVTAAIMLVPTGTGSYRTYRALKSFCPKEVVPGGVLEGTSQALWGIASWCPFLFAFIMAVTVACFKCSGKRMWGWRRLRLTVKGLIIIYTVLGFVGAISFGIMLFIFAGRSSWVGMNWGLGQGFALVLWLPLLYELVHVAVVGFDRGLEVRLPAGFHAVRARDTESDAELELVSGPASGPAQEGAAVQGASLAVTSHKASVESSTAPGRLA